MADPTFLMNPEPQWSACVEPSHAGLFDPAFLRDMAGLYRRQFDGAAVESNLLTQPIPLSACRFPQATEVAAQRSGFDLPTLLVPRGGWNGAYVALAGQDALRRGAHWADRLTVANPWGLSWEGNRSKRGGRLIWSAVQYLCARGFAVYVTDVGKIHVSDPRFAKQPALVVAERQAFVAEVAAVAPHLWITFGGEARRALAGALAGAGRCLALPHPNAHGHIPRDFYGTEDGSHASISAALCDRIAAALAGMERTTA
ncbi:hypothetical protein SAMN04488103_10580 [Gemmobacter aquatilis]|uniref:Uracil DNA glycosylase superfamily protein n=1 Tax=Gemmobacter aquatilis TaxID=933059 RepID=A0A1H8GJL7_9RHOB|nr:hypothetical protein [Gemmobacter aquatilis]SEN43999.1 hypothetical protein SAMN04488103_10580 [Gemmobacter aquatilis]